MSVILPLKVEPGEPILRGNAHYWSIMRLLTADDRSAQFTSADIVGLCNRGDRRRINLYLAALTEAGIVEATPAPKPQSTRYRLLKRPGVAPSVRVDGSRVLTGHEAMWAAIRALRVMTARELSVSATTDAVKVPLETAKRFLRCLSDAGYLKIETAGTNKTSAVYRLKPSMDTGPLPPAILRTKLVYDQNRNEIMGQVLAEEDRP